MSETDKLTQMLENLGIDPGDEGLVHISSGGAAFPAGTFIAPWRAYVAYWFMTEEDPSGIEDEDFVKPDVLSSQGDWYHYYYKDYETANGVYDGFGLEYKPQEVWVFRTETGRIVNRDPKQLEDGFGSEIIVHCPIKPLMMGGGYEQKNRHQYNLIAQPCSVAAFADVAGEENAGFDISELLSYNERRQEAGFDPEKFFAEMCGDPNGDYSESILWQRRVALWKSLGEEDATKRVAMGSISPNGKPNPEATSSEKLSQCLKFSQKNWSGDIWCRVAFVPNPHPDQISDSGNPYSFAVPIEIFASEAEARAAGAEEIEEATGHPPVPENWASAGPDEWIKYLKDKLEGSVPNPGQAASVAAEAYCTAEEVIAWAEYMRDQGEL